MPTDSSQKCHGTGRIADRVLVPACIVVFCLAAFWFTTQFERVPPILKRGIQPSDFPQLVLGLISVLAIAEIFRRKPEIPVRLNRATWLTMGLLAGFVLVAQLDLFLALGSFAAALALLWGERRFLSLFLIGLLFPVAVFFLFDLVFEVRFPRGVLTSLWYD